MLMYDDTRLRLEKELYYGWMPFFRELAEKIYREGEGYLIEKTNEVDWGGGIGASRSLIKFGEDGIDPFSFFYFLASKNTANLAQPVYLSVQKSFELREKFLGQFLRSGQIFPTPSHNLLFHHGEGTYRPNLLWKLFRQAIEGNSHVSQNTFSQVLSIKGVGVVKLTQCLFLINPHEFVPMDKHVGKLILAGSGNVETQIEKEGYARYKELTQRIRMNFPGCAPHEINQFLYLLNKKNILNSTSNLFHVSSQVNTDSQDDYWDDFADYSCIFVQNSTHPTPHPKEGDVILVRFGQNEGRGIGIVLKNEYLTLERLSEVFVIHVNWINTAHTVFDQAFDIGSEFEKIEVESPIYSIFAKDETYRNTFKIVERFRTPVVSIPNDYGLNTILYGPPGTGKTFTTFRYCVEICKGVGKDSLANESFESIQSEYQELVSDGRVEFVTFHQSYAYEEFVEGLRPETDGDAGFRLVAKDGVLKTIAMRARDNLNQRYVLVIDEINRANISKILGELITLLEEDKREGRENQVTAKLPYSNEEFTLPPNLFVVGTMNTADRSIALLDTALRRRFNFEEVPPNPSLLVNAAEQTGEKLPNVLQSINDRIEYLKDRDHLIGHAWLMKAKDRDDLDRIMRQKVIPVIVEYFHDDWQSVQAILGGTDDFVKRKKIIPPPGVDAAYENRYRWRIQDQFPENAYQNLTQGKSTETENSE